MELELIIKNALKAAGLPEGLYSILKHITAEDQVAPAIAGLKSEYDKSVTSESDRRVNQAIKTHDDKLKAEGRLIEPGQQQKTDDKGGDRKPNASGDDDTPASRRIAELEAKLDKVLSLSEGLQTKLTTAEREGAMKARLREAKLPETWHGRVTGESDEDIKASIASLKTEYDSITQAAINDGIKNNTLRPTPGTGGDVGVDALKKAATAISTGTGEFSKGRISEMMAQNAATAPNVGPGR